MAADYVDRILEQWARERPDLDAWPMGVIGRFSRLTRYVEPEIETTFQAHGLPVGGFDVLAALRRAGRPYRLSPTELYNSLLVSSGAMTNRIDRLEEDGLVTRTPDPHDRRSILVALTPKGRRIVDAALTRHVAKEEELLAALSPKENKELARLLRKLLASFEQPGAADESRKVS
jgi:DNA-binding MarR family transcriptional regulator